MRISQLLLFTLVLLISSCRKQVGASTESPSVVYSVDFLNQRIGSLLHQRGAVEWSDLDLHAQWSAIVYSDSLVAIGYKPARYALYPNWIADVHLADVDWIQARKMLYAQLETDGLVSPTVWEEKVLPVLLVKLKSKDQFMQLKRSAYVRYVEPLSYDKQLKSGRDQVESSSGCGSNTPDWDIRDGVHYSVIAPNSKLSWNYSAHGIPTAWNKTSGKGVKVFLVDSGSSWAQDNLGISFNSGASYGRTLERIVTLPQRTWLGIPVGSPETSNDPCGHGTSMAGVMAAPRASDGNAVGIAYNSNLVTCRAAADVFLDESREVKGVVDAFTNAANRADVRIISMSMGRITTSDYIRDAIRYAYGRGKLILAAAGTSFGWTSGWAGVIFPASMPEVQAVTGVKDQAVLTSCDVCHKGPEVDFVVTMERVVDGSHPLTLSDSGDWPSTVGGSSVATASMAGMAALVWARFPQFTRDQLIVHLQRNCSAYPYKTANFGWGRLDVGRATQ